MALETTPRLHRFHFTSFDSKEEALPVVLQELPVESKPAPLQPLLPLPVEAPVITEADVQNARTDAQAQGYREGYAAAQTKIQKDTQAREDAIGTQLEIIANRITLAAEEHLRVMKEREALMSRLVMAAARKIAGDALKREPYAAVESLVRDCMEMIVGAAKIKIVVSGAFASGLQLRVDSLRPMLQGFTGEITVEEDPALLDQDCRVEWGNGFGERNAENLWSAVEDIVNKMNVNS